MTNMATDKTLAWRPVATRGPVAHPCLANLPWIYLGIGSTWRFWFEKGSPMRCRRRASPVRDAENLQRRKSATQKICNAENPATQKICNAEFGKRRMGFSSVSHFGRPGANSAMQKTKICNAEFGVRSSPTPARMRTAAACGPAKRLHKRLKHCFPLCIIA